LNEVDKDLISRLSRFGLNEGCWRLLSLSLLWEMALADNDATDQETKVIAAATKKTMTGFPADVDRFSETIRADVDQRSDAIQLLKEILNQIDSVTADNFREELATELAKLMPDFYKSMKPYIKAVDKIVQCAGLTQRHISGIGSLAFLRPLGLEIPDGAGKNARDVEATILAFAPSGTEAVYAKTDQDFSAAIGDIQKAIEGTVAVYGTRTRWASGIRKLLVSAHEALAGSYSRDDGFLCQAIQVETGLFPQEMPAKQDQGIIIAPKSALEQDVYFVGDLHGDYECLSQVIKISGIETFRDRLLVFLGDYGDRGWATLPTFLRVLELKIRFPDNVILLRGNHETLKPVHENGRLIRWDSETPPDTEYLTAIKEHLFRLGDFEINQVPKDAFELLHAIFEALPAILLLSDGTMALHGLVIPPWGGDRGQPSDEMMAKLEVETLADLRKPEVRSHMIRGRLDNKDIVVYTWAQGGRYCGFQDVKTFMRKLGIKRIIRGHDHPYSGYFFYDALPEVITLCTTRALAGPSQPSYVPKIARYRRGILEPLALFTSPANSDQ
jgi:hypothetical protein